MNQSRSDEPEAGLIRRAADGDLPAIRELVEGQAAYLFAIAKSLVGSSHDAEDLVQETLLAGLESLKRFRGQSRFRTWLVAIFMRQVAEWRRREKVRRTQPLPQASDERPVSEPVLATKDAANDTDIRMDISAALENLSEDYRQVLMLRELGGLSYDEIASTLKLPRGTVESRIHRARMELREHMKGYS